MVPTYDFTDNTCSDNADLADWQSYQNEEYGVYLRYQPFWEASASDVGVNEENRHYLLDFRSLNSEQNPYGDSFGRLPLLQIALINTERDDRVPPSNYGTVHHEQMIGGFSMTVYQTSHSATAVVTITNTIALVVDVEQMMDREAALELLEAICMTLER